jgi:signal transduction histidine kinase
VIRRFGSSVRARLTLFACVTMALICVVVNSFVLFVLHSQTVEHQRVHVVGHALQMAHLVRQDKVPRTFNSPLDGAQVVDPAGRVVMASDNLAGKPRMSRLLPHQSDGRTAVACDLPALPMRCAVLAVHRVYRPDGIWLVYTAEELVPWYVEPAVPLFLLGLSLGLVLVAYAGVSRVVDRTLAPVDRIRARLAEVTASRGDMRVPVPENDDEIRALAETANKTLERLQEAAEQQRRFSSDASHDLRSPITAMRTQLEEALLYPHDTDWPATGRALMDSLDRLQAIVTDLLTLARLDAGAPARHQPVDLAELVNAEAARPRTHRVAVTLEPGVVVTGDPLQLARLLTNLVDNADRHAESTIILTVRKTARAILEVLDDGAGIAPEKREVVFNRFARLDAARSRDAGGTGLGLPIAREIARAHNGTLSIEDSKTGARFVLRLPLRQE